MILYFQQLYTAQYFSFSNMEILVMVQIPDLYLSSLVELRRRWCVPNMCSIMRQALS